MEFNEDGYLPEGVHEMDWETFYGVFSFSPKRKVILKGLENAITQLKACGCTKIYIDGSFVTTKLEPNDYDACWDGDEKCVRKKMEQIEPVFLDFSKSCKNQKEKYKGEIYPVNFFATDRLRYIDFFQQIRGSSAKKGIVVLKL